MTEEIWKDIPGYEGKYQASTLGRIRSVDRVIRMKSRCGKEHDHRIKGRILRPGQFCKAGHVSVVLGHGQPGSPVHQLVARTFLGERPKGADVCHNNGDPKDNRPENLRYDTRTENNLDVLRIGRAWRKLTLEQIHAIRDTPRSITGAELARQYNVSQATISAIRTNRYKSCAINGDVKNDCAS